MIFRNINNIEKPEFLLEYEKLFSKKGFLDIPVFQKDFAVIDIESDGLNPQKNYILSIGGVKIIDGKISVDNSIEIYVEQVSANNNTIHIHGITKNGNQNKLSEIEALQKTIEFIGNAVIVGHNVFFDISIINAALKKHFGAKLKNEFVDTVEMYYRINSRNKSHTAITLDDLCDEYNTPKSDRHTSAGDAFITAIVFLKMIKKLERRGITDLKNLLRKRRLHI